MNVGFRRFFASFSLVALVSVLVAAPSNAATPTGVGSAGGTTTLLSVDYGDILKAALLGENSASSIDPVAWNAERDRNALAAGRELGDVARSQCVDRGSDSNDEHRRSRFKDNGAPRPLDTRCSRRERHDQPGLARIVGGCRRREGGAHVDARQPQPPRHTRARLRIARPRRSGRPDVCVRDARCDRRRDHGARSASPVEPARSRYRQPVVATDCGLDPTAGPGSRRQLGPRQRSVVRATSSAV